jgi:hypothetical protein
MKDFFPSSTKQVIEFMHKKKPKVVNAIIIIIIIKNVVKNITKIKVYMNISINFNTSWALLFLQNVLVMWNCCGHKISSMRFLILILYSILWLTEGKEEKKCCKTCYKCSVILYYGIIWLWVKKLRTFLSEEILFVKVPFQFMTKWNINNLICKTCIYFHDHATVSYCKSQLNLKFASVRY